MALMALQHMPLQCDSRTRIADPFASDPACIAPPEVHGIVRSITWNTWYELDRVRTVPYPF